MCLSSFVFPFIVLLLHTLIFFRPASSELDVLIGTEGCSVEENWLLDTLEDSITNEEYKSTKLSLLHNHHDNKSCFIPWFQPPFASLSRCNPVSHKCECKPSAEFGSNGLCHPRATAMWGSRCDPNRWSTYFAKTIGPMVALIQKLSSPQSVFNAVYYLLYMEYKYIESHVGVPSDAQDACINPNYFLECVPNVTGTWQCEKCYSRPQYFHYREDKRAEAEHRCVAKNGSVCLLRLFRVGEGLEQNATFINTTCDDGLECQPVSNLDFKGRLDLWTCGGHTWKPVKPSNSSFLQPSQVLLAILTTWTLKSWLGLGYRGLKWHSPSIFHKKLSHD